MKTTKGGRVFRTVAATVAGLGAAVLLGPAAAYAGNDDFWVATTDGCGVANFIDYGPGAPGGGNNDDYIVIHDYCADGHGVRAAVWVMGEFRSDRYNGNGLAGAAVIWDPYVRVGPGNLLAGETTQIEICLVDGASDDTGARCRTVAHQMIDG